MSGLLLTLGVGAGLGALLGRFGQCTSGACPLTANWKRGAIYGAVLALLFYFGSGGALSRYQQPKNVKPVADSNFDAEVLRAGEPAVVDFFATWCGPCKVLSPRLDNLAGEFGDRIKFVSVNVDNSPALSQRFSVEGIPTLLFFNKEGTLVERTVGVISADTLRAKLETLAGGSKSNSQTAKAQP